MPKVRLLIFFTCSTIVFLGAKQNSWFPEGRLPVKVKRTVAPTAWKNFLFFSKHLLFWQNTFQKCFESVLSQNTFVFCHTPNNWYHICTYPTDIILFDALLLIIESSHVSPAPSPFRFRRQPLSLSATVNIVLATNAAPAVAAVVGSSLLSPLSLPPLFCLCRHCPMLLSILPSLLPLLLPSLPPPL